MSKIISIANQKGGVGKTTTVVNLSASLAAAQKKTLFVDLDPQGNATSGVGIDKESLQKSIYHTLLGQIPIRETIIDIEPDNLKHNLNAIPSNSQLAGAEIELIQVENREWKLKESLDLIKDSYDFILIDCPPSLNLLTVNALAASDSVLIPVQCEYYAMEGLSDLKRTISLIKQRLNPDLKIEGYLLTMFDTRNNLCHSVANEIKNYFNKEVFQTIIMRNVKLAESPSYGKPIILYDIGSIGANCYISLAKEMIINNGGNSFEKDFIG